MFHVRNDILKFLLNYFEKHGDMRLKFENWNKKVAINNPTLKKCRLWQYHIWILNFLNDWNKFVNEIK
jgi:hypothetical protein